MKRFKAFTLIELLLTIAIIGILATISITALNPQRQLAKARDTQRKTDIYSIASAIYQFSSEHSGDLPDTDGDPLTSNFPAVVTCIGTGGGCFNLGAAGDTEPIIPTYLATMPYDPMTGDQADTDYSVNVDANGRIVVSAVGEVEPVISVTK
ncbi:hypothetical protein A2129_01385 [Candidatus Woesebacteria bacterium GWC1_42_13]|uniref:Type II secretion system protein GspG C-terminal domain-containing protein n=2 Tax=Candidatus Woeseibacteriota TaxID=1752722 RepID=A0A1F7WX82_9BACT|nr:MAG: hypothetical protein A2112_01310 [Candidatus Woesebacteria bacterium GWA1_42_12]OGM06695.1 MAG: hypothetical protein A2129_01385 [Candidatus Woesebacteria bacterium GWC1_42_13]